MKKTVFVLMLLVVFAGSAMLFAEGAEWSPNDAVSLMPTFAPSLTAIAALALGFVNLILIVILFRRTSHRG